MKKLLLPLLAAIAISCSKSDDDCEAKRQAIREKYEAQIQYVKDHPGINGIDWRQISLLQDEMENRMNNACD